MRLLVFLNLSGQTLNKTERQISLYLLEVIKIKYLLQEKKEMDKYGAEVVLHKKYNLMNGLALQKNLALNQNLKFGEILLWLIRLNNSIY